MLDKSDEVLTACYRTRPSIHGWSVFKITILNLNIEKFLGNAPNLKPFFTPPHIVNGKNGENVDDYKDDL